MKVEKLDLDTIGIRFEMRPELIGNFTRGNLHGGVISSVMDVTGGMTRKITEAVKISRSGLNVFFTNGNKPQRITDAVSGKKFEGTLFR